VNFVLDASVALAWVFEDERTEVAMSVLDHLGTTEAMAPAIWPLEVSNALVAAERRNRLRGADAARFSSLLLELPIVVEPLERRRPFEIIGQLARTHCLSTYDAAYLELALRRGIPIATLDARLAGAAAAAGVAQMIQPL
jgi:predicted nucleic acid-binding protein